LPDARAVYERIESILEGLDAETPKRKSVHPKLYRVMTDRPTTRSITVHDTLS
jgi:hypothetical protein